VRGLALGRAVWSAGARSETPICSARGWTRSSIQSMSLRSSQTRLARTVTRAPFRPAPGIGRRTLRIFLGICLCPRPFRKVEVITDVTRRRRFPTKEKPAVVAETMRPGLRRPQAGRKNRLCCAIAGSGRFPIESVAATSKDRPLEDHRNAGGSASQARISELRRQRRCINYRESSLKLDHAIELKQRTIS
jgi:hypothetical protein